MDKCMIFSLFSKFLAAFCFQDRKQILSESWPDTSRPWIRWNILHQEGTDHRLVHPGLVRWRSHIRCWSWWRNRIHLVASNRPLGRFSKWLPFPSAAHDLEFNFRTHQKLSCRFFSNFIKVITLEWWSQRLLSSVRSSASQPGNSAPRNRLRHPICRWRPIRLPADRSPSADPSASGVDLSLCSANPSLDIRRWWFHNPYQHPLQHYKSPQRRNWERVIPILIQIRTPRYNPSVMNGSSWN